MSLARNLANLTNGDDAPVYACRAWINFNGYVTSSLHHSLELDTNLEKTFLQVEMCPQLSTKEQATIL